MVFEISEATLKNLKEQFPHLSEHDIYSIVRRSKIKKKSPDLFGDTQIIYNNYCYELFVPELISDLYEVPDVIELFPDESGIVFMIHSL